MARESMNKRNRERAKQEKAQAKRDRRAMLAEQVTDESPEAGDETEILDKLRALHEAYEAGTISMEELEEQRAELVSQLRIE